jgi:hypothetical protein
VLLEGHVEKLIDVYSEHIEVEPYKSFFTPGGIESMAAHYGVDPTDFPALVEKMEVWSGHPGGIENGVLFHWSTYNPKSKWDWWVVGGRWKNAGLWPDTPRSNFGVIEKIKIPEPFNDIVTPDGEWHESGKHGWFGYHEKAKEDDQWRAEFYEILSGFRTHVAVLIDAHI